MRGWLLRAQMTAVPVVTCGKGVLVTRAIVALEGFGLATSNRRLRVAFCSRACACVEERFRREVRAYGIEQN